MADVPLRARADLISGLIGMVLAAIATLALIAVMSGLQAEAAPAAVPSDVAVFDSDSGRWRLRYGNGSVDTFYFGVPGDIPLLGDWDCDGVDTVALFRPGNGFVYLRNTNDFGVAELSFFYGMGGDIPIAGDWNADGCDTLGVQRNGEFFLANTLGTVPASTQFHYGLPTDIPFAGDFDGDGQDTIGLHRRSNGRLFLSNTNIDGQIPTTEHKFYFGNGTDQMLAGDWDGDGDDTVGAYRAADTRFHLAFEHGQVFSDVKISLGADGWVPVTGYFGEPTFAGWNVLIGAGDIGRCENDFDEATAGLIDDMPGTVITFGDNVYPDGTAAQFEDCFDPTWGRHRDRMRPAPGNHDYHTAGASAYFDYFGTRAGTAGEGWYSYNLGGWHIVALNSNCSDVSGCDAGSPQHTWLVADLAANPASCILAYWHHPRWNAGFHSGSAAVAPLWDALADAGADVVLAGHDHNYQRWGRQDRSGNADPTGIRQFIVGTGGAPFYAQGGTPANLEVFGTDYGVIELQLNPTGYSWEFVPVAGSTFTDSGTESCS